MRKSGAITMKYLLTFILAGVLLALIIWGVYHDRFGSTVDRIGGMADEVLILLGLKDVESVTCGDPFSQDINGVGSGMFYPCDNGCAFVLDGSKELLGYNNFSIDRSGPLIKSSDGNAWARSLAYAFNPTEAQRHKDAYDVLDNTIGKYLKDREMSREKFVEVASFDLGKTLYFEVEDFGDNTAYRYRYDGFWEEGEIEYGKFFKKESKFLNTGDVFQKVYEEFKDGEKVYLGHSEIGSEVDGHVRIDVGIEEFRNYFDEAVGSWGGSKNSYLDLKSDLGAYVVPGRGKRYIKVGDKYTRFIVNPNPDGGGYLISSSGVNVGNIIGSIIAFYNPALQDDSIVKDLENNYKFVGDNLETGKIVLNNGEDGDYSLGDEGGFGYVNVFGEEASQEVVYTELENEHKFMTLKLTTPSKESFGVHYRDSRPNLLNNDRESAVSSFVGLSDEKWEEFIRITKIYEYFKVRRCAA